MKELRLQTPVEAGRSRWEISLGDGVVTLGSCFADSIGKRMADLGFDVTLNPFGTVYNPVSLCNCVARLSSGIPFTEDECVKMGAGSGLYCSFSHHTSFARADKETFLRDANASLSKASASWKKASKVIVTLGTAWIYEYSRTGETVSNCLKVDAREFTRRRLGVREVSAVLGSMVSRFPDKQFTFTGSPIRHLKDGAHGNQLSKSVLLLAVEQVLSSFPGNCDYFPAYEIMMDELRDYRFYAPDMVHPSEVAVDILWDRFMKFAVPARDYPEIENRERLLRRSAHREMH